MRKCYRRGMKSECVEPPEKVAEKLEKKRKMEEEEEETNLAKKSRLYLPPLDVQPPTSYETELIYYLVQSQAELEHPSVDLLDQIDSLVNNEANVEDKTLVHMTQTILATVKLIIEFTKRLPSFQSLC